MATKLDEETRTYLTALKALYPDATSALARIAHLEAELTLVRGTIHVVSDVHGEFKKLKHIVNNASGSLKLLVEQTFGERVSEADKLELLNLIYYPREMYEHVEPRLREPGTRRGFVLKHVRLAFELLRKLAERQSLQAVEALFPEPYRLIFREMLFETALSRSDVYVATMIDRVLAHQEELPLIRAVAHVVRNLLVTELIVAGDLGDRGPRIDKVIEFISRQPNVRITYGNHDAVWLGACLGERTCIATVMRNSLRYRRLSQLEEGYGVPAAPLEKLARTVYADDPVQHFGVKGEGLRDPIWMARMQKAAAIIQFKLEGQMAARNPDFGMESRALLGAIDPARGTVRIDGRDYPLLDTHLPTVDFSDPFRLTAEEEACIARLQESFLFSPVMWQHMQYVARHGAMYLVRDGNLIFHGCVPVDGEGRFLAKEVDGEKYSGRELFDAFDLVIQRAVRSQRRSPRDLDLLYYLWAGPLSPLFGKDKLSTFERYFLEDKATHKETKNPYFKLIHQREFCERVFREFGVAGGQGVIVNGHVPVKVEEGESPLKASGMAITIDGAFSEAYGDKGYTLVLDPTRTYIAQHHHFESVASAIAEGADIVPQIQDVRVFERPRTVGDGEQGEELRREIAMLERLIRAYDENAI